MKDNKNYFLKVRVTKEERDLVKEYCEKHDVTISDLIRSSFNKIFINQEVNSGNQ